MPDSYVIKDQYATYFLTFQIVAWVDIFTRRCYRDIVVEAFNFCVTNKQLQVHAWVIMSNHVHCIVSSSNGGLSNTVRDIKGYTAKQILRSVPEGPGSRREWILFQFKQAAEKDVRNKAYQVWTHENHAVEISPYIKDMGDSKLIYIHNNPAGSGIVEKPEGYLYK